MNERAHGVVLHPFAAVQWPARFPLHEKLTAAAGSAGRSACGGPGGLHVVTKHPPYLLDIAVERSGTKRIASWIIGSSSCTLHTVIGECYAANPLARGTVETATVELIRHAMIAAPSHRLAARLFSCSMISLIADSSGEGCATCLGCDNERCLSTALRRLRVVAHLAPRVVCKPAIVRPAECPYAPSWKARDDDGGPHTRRL